jgi:hypothetical protein
MSSMTVTATGSTGTGIYLLVKCLTGGVEAGGAIASRTGAATGNLAFTPNRSASLLLWTLIRNAAQATQTAAAGNTIYTQGKDSINDATYAFGYCSGTVAAGSAVTLGATTGGGQTEVAAYEIIPATSGVTPAIDAAASPAFADSTASGTVTTAAFTPQPGETIVVMVGLHNTSGTPAMTITNTAGLTFTQRVAATLPGGGGEWIFTATVPYPRPEPAGRFSLWQSVQPFARPDQGLTPWPPWISAPRNPVRYFVTASLTVTASPAAAQVHRHYRSASRSAAPSFSPARTRIRHRPGSLTVAPAPVTHHETAHVRAASLTARPGFSAGAPDRTIGADHAVTPAFSAQRAPKRVRAGHLTVTPSLSGAAARTIRVTASLTVIPSRVTARTHVHGRPASLRIAPSFSIPPPFFTTGIPLAVIPGFSAAACRRAYRSSHLTVTPAFTANRKTGRVRTGTLAVTPSASATATRLARATATVTPAFASTAARIPAYRPSATLAVAPSLTAAHRTAHVRTAGHQVIPAFRAARYAGSQYSMLVPLYEYPEPPAADWVTVTAAAPPVRYLVVNPDSGPGNSADPNYVTVIGNAQAAGLTVLGYIDTDHSTVAISAVQADAGLWETLYGVTSVFLDRVSSTATYGSTYAAVYGDSYVTAAGSGGYGALFGISGTTVLNVGAVPDEEFASYGDVIVVFDGPYSAWSSFTPGSWFSAYPPGKFGVIAYDAETAAEMKSVISAGETYGIGVFYVTDGVGDFAGLPAYFSSELTYVSGLAAGSLTVTPAFAAHAVHRHYRALSLVIAVSVADVRIAAHVRAASLSAAPAFAAIPTYDASLTVTPSFTVGTVYIHNPTAALIPALAPTNTQVASHTCAASLTVTLVFFTTAGAGASLAVTPRFSAGRVTTRARAAHPVVTPALSGAATRTIYRLASLTVTPSRVTARTHVHGRTGSLTVAPSFSIPPPFTARGIPLAVIPGFSAAAFRRAYRSGHLTVTPALAARRQASHVRARTLAVTPSLSATATRLARAAITVTPSSSAARVRYAFRASSLTVTPSLSGAAENPGASWTLTGSLAVILAFSPAVTVAHTRSASTGAGVSLAAVRARVTYRTAAAAVIWSFRAAPSAGIPVRVAATATVTVLFRATPAGGAPVSGRLFTTGQARQLWVTGPVRQLWAATGEGQQLWVTGPVRQLWVTGDADLRTEWETGPVSASRSLPSPY